MNLEKADAALSLGGKLYLAACMAWWAHNQGGWQCANRLILRRPHLRDLLYKEGVQSWSWPMAVRQWLASLECDLWAVCKRQSLHLCLFDPDDRKYFPPEEYVGLPPGSCKEVLDLYGETVFEAWCAWNGAMRLERKLRADAYEAAFRGFVMHVTYSKVTPTPHRTHLLSSLDPEQMKALRMLDDALCGHLSGQRASVFMQKLLDKP